MNEELSEETSSEDDGLTEFASKALHLHRKGSFESLLAQHLILSVPLEGLTKTRLICEAYYMCPKDKLKVDRTLVQTIYDLTLGFQSTLIEEYGILVSWPFQHTKENYERYVKPWRRKTELCYCGGNSYDNEKKDEYINKFDEVGKFFALTSDASIGLHPSGFQLLKTEFLLWAMPIMMDVFEELSRQIDPDLYKEMLLMLKTEVKPK
jgi:hypothetical protein